MLRRLHAAAGCLALLALLSFWTSTLIAEGFLDWPAIATVKSAIVGGLFVLIPSMILAGTTGAALSRRRGGSTATKAKATRMKILAANGVLIMIPAALYLNAKAAVGAMDGPFLVVQMIELAVGAVQIALMTMNLRDGLRLSRQRGVRLVDA